MVTSVNYIMVLLNEELKGCAVESLVFRICIMMKTFDLLNILILSFDITYSLDVNFHLWPKTPKTWRKVFAF